MSPAWFEAYRATTTFGQRYRGGHWVSQAKISVSGDDGDYVATVAGTPEISDIYGAGPTKEAACADLHAALRGVLDHLTECEAGLSSRLQLQLECLKEYFAPAVTASPRMADPASTVTGLRPLIVAASNYTTDRYTY